MRTSSSVTAGATFEGDVDRVLGEETIKVETKKLGLVETQRSSMRVRTGVQAGVSAGAVWDWVKAIVTGEPRFEWPSDSAVC